MSRSRRRIQKNGRERGNPGHGDGPVEYSPTVVHKGRRDWQDRQDRKRKENGWRDED